MSLRLAARLFGAAPPAFVLALLVHALVFHGGHEAGGAGAGLFLVAGGSLLLAAMAFFATKAAGGKGAGARNARARAGSLLSLAACLGIEAAGMYAGIEAFEGRDPATFLVAWLPGLLLVAGLAWLLDAFAEAAGQLAAAFAASFVDGRRRRGQWSARRPAAIHVRSNSPLRRGRGRAPPLSSR